jgi:two-component system LytT family response regulator
VRVTGEAGTVQAARELLARGEYALVFLDIQLRGGSGLDLVPHVREGAAVIFVTAHDEYAIRAFEVNALDYLLKPIKPERLAASLARLNRRREETGVPLREGTRLRRDDTVYVRTDSGARFLPVGEIVAIQSCENYSELSLRAGERFLVRQTLKSWEDQLPLPPFARAHRQVIVNLDHLQRIEEDRGDAPLLHLRGLRAPVRASRREWTELREFLPAESGRPLRFETTADRR